MWKENHSRFMKMQLMRTESTFALGVMVECYGFDLGCFPEAPVLKGAFPSLWHCVCVCGMGGKLEVRPSWWKLGHWVTPLKGM